MALSLDYVVRETGTNLWRNRLMSIAAVLTVAVSLSLVGGALIVKQGASTATARWKGNVGLAVFMQPGASPDQTTAVAARLTSLEPARVRSFRYVDQTASFAEMHHLFANQPDLIQGVKSGDLPPSYRVVLHEASQAPAVGNLFPKNQGGVREVSYPSSAIKTMLSITRIAQAVIVVLAAILLLSASVLILNAIRMAIFARRREVAVMKLVGATDWFIRVPFMLEGLLQGLVGAIAACGAVVGLHWGLGYAVQHFHASLLTSLVVSGHDVFVTELFILAMGAVVGSFGSALAVRRFLEV